MEIWELLQSYINHHLLIAAGLGFLIGLEREIAGKDPSLRTFTLISLGACVFSLISAELAHQHADADPGRIAAQIVSGMGFLGAGVIFRGNNRVSGFTTAALMWFTAGVGMAVGFDQIDLAVSATIIALVMTYLLKLVHYLIERVRGRPQAQQEDNNR